MAGSTLIEGIGDEVVLFVGFLVLSAGLLVYFTLRQASRGQNSGPRVAQESGGTLGRESHASGSEAPTEEEVPVRPQADTTPRQTQYQGSDGLRQRSNVSAPSEDRNEPPTSRASGRGTPQEAAAGDSAGGGEQEPGEGEIRIRLIQAGGPGHAREVCVSPRIHLGQLRSTYFSTEVAEYRPVKFIYQGRVLQDNNTTLLDLGIGDGGAMHVHVGRPRPPGAPQEPEEGEMLDLSRLFVPLFGVILGIVWVAMLSYPHVFTFMTKFFLFLLSTGYVILAYVSTFGN